MPAYRATAPGKIILFGEHAVVYQRPAIAVPVTQVEAQAIVQAELASPAGRVQIRAPGVGLDAELSTLGESEPLARAVRLTLEELGIERPPAFQLRVTSTIPIAAGLGSGAAVSVAVIRALAGFLGRPLEDGRVSALAFEVEKLHHGTPSGIDNTVITCASPVFFVRDQAVQPLKIGRPLTFVIADTGVPSPTAATVGDVRAGWQADPARFEGLFDQVEAIVLAARSAMEAGEAGAVGRLMTANQALLVELGVSSALLDHLVAVALEAGSLGAKLSGGGRGGNLIALATPDRAPEVAGHLERAGAPRTLVTTVEAT